MQVRPPTWSSYVIKAGLGLVGFPRTQVVWNSYSRWKLGSNSICHEKRMQKDEDRKLKLSAEPVSGNQMYIIIYSACGKRTMEKIDCSSWESVTVCQIERIQPKFPILMLKQESKDVIFLHTWPLHLSLFSLIQPSFAYVFSTDTGPLTEDSCYILLFDWDVHNAEVKEDREITDEGVSKRHLKLLLEQLS